MSTPQESWDRLSDDLKRLALAYQGAAPFDAAVAAMFTHLGEIAVVPEPDKVCNGLPMFRFSDEFDRFLTEQTVPPSVRAPFP